MNSVDIFKRHLAQTSNNPLSIKIERAEGVFLYDEDGHKYLDAISGISVSVLGHQHQSIKRALQEQINKHLHVMVYGEVIQESQVRLIELLYDTLPSSLNCCYLVNSGSEATEGALKLAKRYTQRLKVVYCHNGYHGSSHGALSVTGSESLKRNYRPMLPGGIEIEYGDIDDLEKIDGGVAAVIVETVQGEAGVRLGSKEYFNKLRSRCDVVGALLILDEVQCGIGRTGRFWAFEHYDIVPDILLSAKGLGGGLPLGAFISSKEVMSCLRSDPVLGHISTFGGHPLSCASAIATIKTIMSEGLMEGVLEKHNLFLDLLSKIEGVVEVRGIGLLLAVELGCSDKVKRVISTGLSVGLFTDWFLFCDTAIRLSPPLTIGREEIIECCELLSRSISKS